MKRHPLLLLLILSLACATFSFGQSRYGSKKDADFNLGLGLGIDYGGMGVKFNYRAFKHISAFGGVGLNTLNVAANVGVTGRFFVEEQFVPYVIAMYGYNGLIKSSDNYKYNFSYYGPSAGLGVEAHFKSRNYFFAFEVLYPYRPEFDTDADIVLNDPNVFRSKWVYKLPVLVSLGFHFQLHPSSNKKFFRRD